MNDGKMTLYTEGSAFMCVDLLGKKRNSLRKLLIQYLKNKKYFKKKLTYYSTYKRIMVNETKSLEYKV